MAKFAANYKKIPKDRLMMNPIPKGCQDYRYTMHIKSKPQRGEISLTFKGKIIPIRFTIGFLQQFKIEFDYNYLFDWVH
jgi:hypothetical protein